MQGERRDRAHNVQHNRLHARKPANAFRLAHGRNGSLAKHHDGQLGVLQVLLLPRVQRRGQACARVRAGARLRGRGRDFEVRRVRDADGRVPPQHRHAAVQVRGPGRFHHHARERRGLELARRGALRQDDRPQRTQPAPWRDRRAGGGHKLRGDRWRAAPGPRGIHYEQPHARAGQREAGEERRRRIRGRSRQPALHRRPRHTRGHGDVNGQWIFPPNGRGWRRDTCGHWRVARHARHHRPCRRLQVLPRRRHCHKLRLYRERMDEGDDCRRARGRRFGDRHRKQRVRHPQRRLRARAS